MHKLGLAGKLAAIAMVLASTASAAEVLDLNSSGAVATEIGEGTSYYITNTGSAPKSGQVAGDWNVVSGGKLYIGFTGKDTAGGAAIAADRVTMDIAGNMNVAGASWVGKWNTLMYSAFFPELPVAPVNDVVLNVGGNLDIDIDADGFGAFMVGAEGVGSSTVINVAGDTIIRSGGNHFTGYKNGVLDLTTRTFNLIGGEIEVIGTSRVMTTNTDSAVAAVHLADEAELTIMRGATFDQSRGGNFLVEGASTLKGGSGGGTIMLKDNAGASVIVSEDSVIDLWRGSLAVTGAGSTLDVSGTVILGFHPSLTDADGNRFTSLTAVNMNIQDAARVTITDDFMKKARADYATTDANALVMSAANLSFGDWQSGDKALIDNLYGKFNFTRNGNDILFKNVEATDLTNTGVALAASSRQVAKQFERNGIHANNVASGLSANVLGVGRSIAAGSAKTDPAVADLGQIYVESASSDAGNINWAILSALAADNDAFAASAGGNEVGGHINSGLVNILNNNRGSNVNAVAMNVAGQAQSSIQNRITANSRALARVSEAAGSDYALASAILDCNYMNRVWVGGLGLWEDADTRKGLSGYEYDSYGVMAGYDRLFGPVTVGAAFDFTGGDFEDKAAVSHDSTIDNYSFNLYAAYNHCSGFFASVIGGYTYSDNDINEYDGSNWAKEDFHTNSWSIGAKFGYDWRVTPCLTLTPSVGINYIHASNSSHQVEYAGTKLLRYGDMKNHATNLPVELAASYEVVNDGESTLNLNANVGYSYNFHNDGVNGDISMNGLGGASVMRAVGREPGRHTFNAGAGLKYVRNRFDVGVKYDYYGKADYDAHRVSATFGISF